MGCRPLATVTFILFSTYFSAIDIDVIESQAVLISSVPQQQLQRAFSSSVSETVTGQCVSTISQRDCPKGEALVANAGLAGVCPGCKGGLDIRGRCGSDEECAPGLNCLGGRCAIDVDSCWHTLHLEDIITVLPTCDIHGTFSAVQCKGDQITGRCFCYSEIGERIFGWDWWQNSDTMTCACSRWRHKLETSGQTGAFLRCAQSGNYEELQCTTKLCWCADPVTGEQQNGTRVVPIDWWYTLECYDASIHGDTYPWQCESVNFATSLLQDAYYPRGTINVPLRNKYCDYDGSFGEHLIENGLVYCTWRDGTKIGTFSAVLAEIERIDCNCARDKMIYSLSSVEHSLACKFDGSYRDLQEQNGQFFCVDEDGYAVTPLSPFPPKCEDYLWRNS